MSVRTYGIETSPCLCILEGDCDEYTTGGMFYPFWIGYVLMFSVSKLNRGFKNELRVGDLCSHTL